MRGYFANIYRSVKSILTGMAVTIRYMGKHTVTVQYPAAIPPIDGRYRGFHEYDIEKCNGCGLCLKACPVDCIYLQVEGKGKNAVIRRYAVDFGKCLLCGLCADACPTGALHMGKLHDLSGYSREDVIVEYVELARAGRRTPEPIWLARAGKMKASKRPAWLGELAARYPSGLPIIAENKPPDAGETPAEA